MLPAWHVHPDVWLLFGSIIAAYLIAGRRHERATGEATEPRKRRLFLLGMGVLWLGADWPIHDLAERYLYSMHMTQHLLFTLVAAPILIAGMPAWLLRELLSPAPIACPTMPGSRWRWWGSTGTSSTSCGSSSSRWST